MVVDTWNNREQHRSVIASILAEIQERAASFSSFSLVYVKRGANWLAHLCAQHASRYRVDCTWGPQPPPLLRQSLHQFDCNPYD
ncbi:hypothetical protein BAE44_0001594 [Dichanthelium oligosanthes]|uniref:RNase H type-1 domain-containing protein n=1 Tax=Dichanthelium oligosanthes TaxID=888268 RepID=A0A1E5WIZ6_9POAL|nr:hypothetical protein BAE44_0001594 [Dichanthelium oligosanthes]